MMTADNATSGPPTPAETVLVVEDDPLLRRLISKALRARGYTVLEASRADEALQLCADNDGPVEMLITDLVLPVVSGSDLAARATAKRPTLKVLFISGYREDAVVGEEASGVNAAFLQKPFMPAR